jgi:cell wall-associated NlpC family hydrolase
MRKILIMIFLLNNGFLIIGQSKTFSKLNVIYKKGKPTKLIKKATKASLKNKRDAIPYYFISLGNYSLYTTSNYSYNFNKAVSNLKKAKKYNSNNAYWNLLEQEFIPLKNTIEKKVSYQYTKNKKKSLKLCETYITLFGDTLPEYIQLFIKKSLTKLDRPAITNTNTSYWSEKRDSIKAFANKFVGTPYKWAGENPGGFDCSGFVKYVYKYVGIKLPHNADKISYLGEKVSEKNAKTGDIILFGYTNEKGHHAYHAGIIYENIDGIIKLIHSITSGVHVTSDYENYWKERTLFIRNLIDFPLNDELVNKK